MLTQVFLLIWCVHTVEWVFSSSLSVNEVDEQIGNQFYAFHNSFGSFSSDYSSTCCFQGGYIYKCMSLDICTIIQYFRDRKEIVFQYSSWIQVLPLFAPYCLNYSAPTMDFKKKKKVLNSFSSVPQMLLSGWSKQRTLVTSQCSA